MRSIDVVLLSGQSAKIFWDAELTVQELKQKAQEELQAPWKQKEVLDKKLGVS